MQTLQSEMRNASKVDHLAGRAHARKLISEPSTLPVPPHVNFTMSETPVIRKAKEKGIAKSNSATNHPLQS